MKIVFDNIIFSLQKSGGISTYWYEIIKRADNYENDILFIEEDSSINNIVRKSFNNKGKIYNIKFPILIQRFFFFIKKFFKEKYIFHSSYNRISIDRNAINILTIHDFVHEKYLKGLRKSIHSIQKKIAINNADAIIVISKNTQKDLFDFYPNINRNKVFLIYNGVSNDFFQLNYKNPNLQYYFLFVGSRQSYKNFNIIVDFISKTDKKYGLCIVGLELNMEEELLLNNKLFNRWILYSSINNEKLNELYNSTFALLYLSSYEGFGIPLLEAMKSGCPFIGLNASSIPEVAGDAGYLINNLDFYEFLTAVEYINHNREYVIHKGLTQSTNFTWEKCYNETLKVYLNTLNSNK